MPPDEPGKDRGLLTLYYTQCSVPTASGIAFSQGILQESMKAQGLRVRSLADAEQGLSFHHFEHANGLVIRDGGNVPAIYARAGGQDTQVVAMCWVPHTQLVLALPSSGIRTLADLKGRRLAVPRRPDASMDFWRAQVMRSWQQALSVEGLTFDDVELVELPVSGSFLSITAREDDARMFGAAFQEALTRREIFGLIRGEVDAVFLTQQGPQKAAFLGATVVADLMQLDDQKLKQNNLTPTVLTANRRFISERPDLVVELLVRVLRAAKWAEQNPSDAFRLIARAAGLAETWARAAYPPNLPALLAPSFTDDLVDALGAQVDFLVRSGMIDGVFDVESWLRPEFLSEALSLVG